MTDVNGIPVLQDEVNRKAFNTMEWLFSSLNSGNMSPRQFSTGVDALFMTTSGLVDDAMMTLMAEADALTEKGEQLEKSFFIKGNTTMRLTWGVGSNAIHQDAFCDGKFFAAKGHVFPEPAGAAAGMKKLAARLTAAGYEPL
ncbi:hypothetical protein LP414_27350 [Polaromonas sp. P1(28)-13]|nr:hypothetical protein LP414_27350 [Polaromonas sp. P1(28)-13]